MRHVHEQKQHQRSAADRRAGYGEAVSDIDDGDYSEARDRVAKELGTDVAALLANIEAELGGDPGGEPEDGEIPSPETPPASDM